MKTCVTCSAEKPESEFHTRQGGPALWPYCKVCANKRSSEWRKANRDKVNAAQRARRQRVPEEHRAVNRKQRLKRYGLTLKDYDAMVAAQDGRCAGCGDLAPLRVDHDHDTGEVRGLLCHGCNVSLGLVKDKVETLMSLAAYLMQSERAYDPKEA